jgi:molecular chaperone DnaK (HSP70)
MATRTRTETRYAVLVETAKGDRAVFTVPVNLDDPQPAADRAAHVAALREAEGHTVRITTFTHEVSR